jgi:hypothetical protein
MNNPADTEAQRFIQVAASSDPKLIQELRQNLARRDARGQFLTMWQGRDYIDVRSRALSIAYHAFRGTKLSEFESRAIFDNANIALLPNGNLSWNALMFQVNADEAEALARNQAKPTPEMWNELGYVEKWFLSLGFKSIGPARELYVRHTGNVRGAVQPLTGAMMLMGGVPNNEALGSFGYHFDARGGIRGLREAAAANGFNSTEFKQPLLNIGIRHALIRDVPNLAVISPASGFEGYASSAGRIVEYNVGVGQGVGIAAAMAMATGKNLADMTNAEVRQVLAATGQLPKIYGQTYMADAQALAAFEQKLGTGIMIA